MTNADKSREDEKAEGYDECDDINDSGIWDAAVISARLYLADKEEVKILTTVVLSLPFFLVDVVYMMCFAFESLAGDYQRFNVIAGNVTLQLTMQVIMEFIVVGLYLGLGLELPSKAGRGEFGCRW